MFDNLVSVPYVEHDRERIAIIQRNRELQKQGLTTTTSATQPSALRSWFNSTLNNSSSSLASSSASSSKSSSPAPDPSRNSNNRST